MKKYIMLRICKGCDEQRMVDDRGYCAKCNAAERVANIVHPMEIVNCPDCKGKGIVKDGFSQLFECSRCHGSGHVAKASR